MSLRHRTGTAAGAVALAALLAAPALPSSAQAADLIVSNWDGYMAPDIAERFQAETGLELEVVNHATNEEIMGKLMASGGKGLDLVFVSSPFAEVLNHQGLAAGIDHAEVPNLANLYPAATEFAYDPGNAFSVPYTWGTTGLCYRSDLVGQPVESWDILLDPPAELEGKVTMLSTDRWLMAAGLLATGHSVNATDEAAIEEAKQALIEAKKQLLAYDDTTFYSKLVSGEASLVHAWDGWCNYGIAENGDIRFVVPQEGSDLWVDTMVVMEASENKEAAHRFIDFVLDPANHAWAVENILYKVPNRVAMERLPASLVEQYPNLGMSPEELTGYQLMRDLGEAQRAYSRAVSEIKAAN